MHIHQERESGSHTYIYSHTCVYSGSREKGNHATKYKHNFLFFFCPARNPVGSIPPGRTPSVDLLLTLSSRIRESSTIKHKQPCLNMCAFSPAGVWRYHLGRPVEQFPDPAMECRAILEHRAFSMLYFAERCGLVGPEHSADRLVCCGGGAKSLPLLQILADVFGCSVFTCGAVAPALDQTSPIPCGDILAALGAGWQAHRGVLRDKHTLTHMDMYRYMCMCIQEHIHTHTHMHTCNRML